jgi:hypothetical protein
MYYSQIKVLVNAAIHYEHGKVIQCDFKPGSVERSIDLDKEGRVGIDHYKCSRFLLVSGDSVHRQRVNHLFELKNWHRPA